MMIPSWLEALIRISAIAGVLVVVVIAVQAIAGRWLSAKWRYLLSALVVARLLVPVTFESGWAVQPGERSSVQSRPPSPADGPGLALASDTVPGDIADESKLSGGISYSPDARSVGAGPLPVGGEFRAREVSSGLGDGGGERPPPPLAWPQMTASGMKRTAVGVWVCGVLVVLGTAAVRHLRMMAAVGGLPRVTDPGLREVFDRCRRRMGIGRDLILVEAREVPVPVVFGFWRPRVILPVGLTGALSAAEREHIFLHELAHVRAHDVAVNWLLVFLRALHWFNPLVRLGIRRFVADREAVRDAQVLAVLGAGERASYGRTLLRLLGPGVDTPFGTRLSAGAAPMLTKKQDIKQRIIMITRHHQQRRAGTILGLAISSLLAFASFTVRGQHGNVGEENTSANSEPAEAVVSGEETSESALDIGEANATEETILSGELASPADDLGVVSGADATETAVEVEVRVSASEDALAGVPGETAATNPAGNVLSGDDSGIPRFRFDDAFGDPRADSDRKRWQEIESLYRRGRTNEAINELLGWRVEHPDQWSESHARLLRSIQRQPAPRSSDDAWSDDARFFGADSEESHPRRRHLEEAYRNLREAGLPEEAERVRRHLEAERRTDRPDGEQLAKMMRQMDALARQAEQLQKQLQEVRGHMDRMREEMQHLLRGGERPGN